MLTSLNTRQECHYTEIKILTNLPPAVKSLNHDMKVFKIASDTNPDQGVVQKCIEYEQPCSLSYTYRSTVLGSQLNRESTWFPSMVHTDFRTFTANLRQNIRVFIEWRTVPIHLQVQ
jgi:hypothetical protein